MRDVIEAIDNALDDWDTSADAMRWTPEKASEPTRRAATFDQLEEAARLRVEEASRRSEVTHGGRWIDYVCGPPGIWEETMDASIGTTLDSVLRDVVSSDVLGGRTASDHRGLSLEGQLHQQEEYFQRAFQQYGAAQREYLQRTYSSVLPQDSDVSLSISSTS